MIYKQPRSLLRAIREGKDGTPGRNKDQEKDGKEKSRKKVGDNREGGDGLGAMKGEGILCGGVAKRTLGEGENYPLASRLRRGLRGGRTPRVCCLNLTPRGTE